MLFVNARVFVLIAIVLGVSLYARRAKAAPQDGFPQAACVSYVPQSWGDYQAGSQQSGLAFQDKNGTLRFLTTLPCGAVPLVALEIRRGSGKGVVALRAG
jgi:hypothetical protein